MSRCRTQTGRTFAPPAFERLWTIGLILLQEVILSRHTVLSLIGIRKESRVCGICLWVNEHSTRTSRSGMFRMCITWITVRFQFILFLLNDYLSFFSKSSPLFLFPFSSKILMIHLSHPPLTSPLCSSLSFFFF